MDLEKVSTLIKNYFLLIKNPEEKNFEAKRTYLESILRDIVLTGEEIVKKGILENILKKEEDIDIKNTHIEALKNGIIKLGNRHKELIKVYSKLEDDPNYEEVINEIRDIISGKQGTIIEEIRNVLPYKEECSKPFT